MLDVCDDDTIIRVSNCPSCKPNPSAVVPKWKTRDVDEPWFNDKYCTFQITVVTTAGQLVSPNPAEMSNEEYVDNLFDKYKMDAIQVFLTGLIKKKALISQVHY